MKKVEVLLAEHRELVELYKHQWTTIFYMGVSYVILNGALASVVGFMLSLEQTTFVITAFLVAFLVAICGNIFFFLFTSRIQVHLVSLVNRAVAIENILQQKELPLDTFRICSVAIREGEFLMDSKGSYAKLKAWQKIGIVNTIYIFALLIGFSWIILLIVYLTTLLR